MYNNYNIPFSKKKYSVIFLIFTIISFLIPAIPGIVRDFRYPLFLDFLNNQALQLVLYISFPIFWIIAFSLFLMFIWEKYLSWEVIVQNHKWIQVKDIKTGTNHIVLFIILSIPTLLFLYTFFSGYPYYEILLVNLFFFPIVWAMLKK